MIFEIFLLKTTLENQTSEEFFVSEQNAQQVGINILDLHRQFENRTGRVILDNENIKVRFANEGDHLDFSTFDGVSIRVDFNSQTVAPNKGGDLGR